MHGSLLGITAGIIITCFDNLYMFVPKIYIPLSYPGMLVLFNICFWTVFGGLCGISLCTVAKYSKKIPPFMNSSWILFFLVPFIVIYGILGILPLAGPAKACFDQHLSFAWCFSIALFLYLKEIKSPSSMLRTFIPEMVAIVLLFNFCSNTQEISSYLLGPGFVHNSFIFMLGLYLFGSLLILGSYYIFSSKLECIFQQRKGLILAGLCAVLFTLSISIYYYRTYSYPTDPSHSHSSANTAEHTPVILIVLDTVRADRLSSYSSHQTSKNLEAFSRDAVIYDQCVAPSSYTLASHASLFTGLYPSEHGSYIKKTGNDWLGGLTPLADSFTTLAEILGNKGYTTAAVVANSYQMDKSFNLDQGFQTYDCLRGISASQMAFKPLLNSFCYATGIFPKYILPYRTADDINRSVFQLLQTELTSPYFLFVNYMDAHSPCLPPRPYSLMFTDSAFPFLYKYKRYFLRLLKNSDSKVSGLSPITQYDGAIAFLDSQLGRLFTALKELDYYDSSLIIVTSDHGELFGTHGYNGHTGPLYEGVARIPLIVKYPGSQKTGRVFSPISLTSVFPFILNQCNIPVPDTSADISPVVAEFYSRDKGVHRCLYSGQYKLLVFDDKQSELYNINKDPLETDDLTQAQPKLVAKLQRQLDDWVKQHIPPAVATDQKESTVDDQVISGLKSLGYIE